MSEAPDPSTQVADEDASAVSEAKDQWQSEVRGPHVEAHGERADFRTQAMRWPVEALYTPADLEATGFDYLTDLGFPGEYPYTRGVRPNGHRSNLWTMMQTTGFGSGEAWAKRARYMLEQGLQGLFLEYDLATTNGYDSDNPLVEGEVGRAGMALDSLEDLERAFDLPFEKLKHLTSVCNAPQPVNLSMVIAALERKGVDPSSLTLGITNGILIEHICVGRYIYPPKHGLRVAIDCMEYMIRNYPNWRPLSIISAQLQPAKANPVQEIAFSLVIAMAYIDELLERGFTIDEVAPYVHFVINVDMDFFEGICKIRAYRKCWARLMKERYGATSPEAMQISMTTSPTTTALTLQQPLNNIGRLAIMATACALAGAGDAMNTPLHDEAHALPAEEAIRVGAALQHIVAHETGVADTIDPLAGSYYVESLTKRLETESFEEIDKIVEMGGAIRAIETGYFQRALGRGQYERNKEVEEGERKWVGVNHLVVPDEKREIDVFRLADDVEDAEIAKVKALRARRDGEAVERALERVREAARNGDNLMPPCLEAVEVYATHGEICDAMRDVFGEYTPNTQLAGV